MKKKILLILLAILVATAIFGVNLWMVSPWLTGKGPLNIGSIEVSYVSMGRFLRDFYPHLSWGPFWYFGFPFHLFYTPLLPVLEVMVNKFGGFSLWQSYRIISGLGFALAPVSLFLFVWCLTKKIIPGILAALLYTFLPTLFCFVLPTKEVANDIISTGFFDPRRLVIMARWGEGPHTLSLAFLPLGGLFFLRVFRTKKLADMVLAGIFVGLTALTNAIGLYALLVLIFAIFFSQLVHAGKTRGQVMKLTLVTGAISYGLIAFWYNLSFLGSFFSEGGGVFKNYLAVFPWGFIVLLFGIVGLYYLFKRVIKNEAVAVSFIWFLILFLVVYIYYVSAPPEFSEKRLEFAPQALRLMTASDMAFSVFLSVIFGILLSFLERKGLVLKVAGNLMGVVLIAGVLVYGFQYLPSGQKAVSGEIDLTKTGEYEIANWLQENIDKQKGERVYVAGNYGFYLNYFTDIWQLRGGLYQAITHHWPEHIYYQINHEKDKELASAWLKAANIKYIVVNTATSRELYREFKVLDKFNDFDIARQNRGDIVYEIPLGGTGPAKVVEMDIAGTLLAPQKADDKKPILAYVKWLDKTSPASFEVINNDTYKIIANVAEGQGILVQMTYDKGFSAFSNKGRLKIKKDPLGFMLLLTNKPGDYEITLRHGKTWKLWLGYLTTTCTVVGLLFIAVRKKVKSR